MANVTNISVLNSAAATATVSTLDAFRSDIGTSSLTMSNATASLLNATVTGTATISGAVTVANSTAASLVATVIGTAVLAAGASQVGSVTAVISGTLPVSLNSTTAGGLLKSSTLCTGTNNTTNVKASAGQLYHVAITNNTATIAYVKFYDATAAIAGSGTPVWRIMVPGNSSGAGIVEEITNGLVFSTGISFATTGGIADTDTSVVTANALLINLGYK